MGGTGTGGGGSDGTTTGGSAGSGGTGGTPELIIEAFINRSACDRFVDYEAWVHVDSPLKLALIECVWDFGDTASTACSGVHEFALPGEYPVSVVAREPVSGAQDVVDLGVITVYEGVKLSVEAEAPECGLSFSYTITNTDGRPGGLFSVIVSPREQVVSSDPEFFERHLRADWNDRSCCTRDVFGPSLLGEGNRHRHLHGRGDGQRHRPRLFIAMSRAAGEVHSVAGTD
jgi:hypothetical protein